MKDFVITFSILLIIFGLVMAFFLPEFLKCAGVFLAFIGAVGFIIYSAWTDPEMQKPKPSEPLPRDYTRQEGSWYVEINDGGKFDRRYPKIWAREWTVQILEDTGQVVVHSPYHIGKWDFPSFDFMGTTGLYGGDKWTIDAGGRTAYLSGVRDMEVLETIAGYMIGHDIERCNKVVAGGGVVDLRYNPGAQAMGNLEVGYPGGISPRDLWKLVKDQERARMLAVAPNFEAGPTAKVYWPNWMFWLVMVAILAGLCMFVTEILPFIYR